MTASTFRRSINSQILGFDDALASFPFPLQTAPRPLPPPLQPNIFSGIQVSSLWVGLCVMCGFLLLGFSFSFFLFFQKAIKMGWVGGRGLMGWWDF